MRTPYHLDRALAENIARRRRAAGLTQNDVALATGLSEVVVCRYETLRAPIPPERLERIEEVLAEAESRLTQKVIVPR